MHTILGHLQFVRVYIDDIVIFSRTMEDHFTHLREVLSILEDADLRINGSKCQWFRREINLLGYHVSEDGIKADASKVKAIHEMRPPYTIKQLQTFLGLTGYYYVYSRLC